MSPWMRLQGRPMSSTDQDVRQRNVARHSLSRSPHPYHRQSISVRDKDVPDLGKHALTDEPPRSSDSSEDQAIEADDEKGPLLRLPAPPIPVRKGLKGVHDASIGWTPNISPEQSPLREKPAFVFSSAQNDPGTDTAQQEKDEKYTKYVRRRRTEIARRITETLLVAIIGLLSSLKRSSECPDGSICIRPSLLKWSPELICFFTLVGVCYGSFPVRRARRLVYSWGVAPLSAMQKGFHIPSRFDPGILVYPVLLPLCIAASLRSDDAAIIINIVLGIASVPMEVIPFNRSGGFYLQWASSVLPISLLRALKKRPSVLKLSSDSPAFGLLEISLLFPLHQNLLQVLSALVTTSLDPSEIQLLSAGLINLLIFASSPQAQILKALLWVGGLCLFIFCETALKTEVTLARIPAWRFARNRPSKSGIAGRMNRLLKAVMPEQKSRFAALASSDSEDETSPKLRPPRSSRQRSKRTSSPGESSDHCLQRTVSASQTFPRDSFTYPANLPSIARSYTFSAYGRAATFAIRWKKIATIQNPMLRLTNLQAQALKILLAFYTYSIVGLTILLPVRYFINYRALYGNEAIGWAIGYFLGDVPEFRMFVVNNNLDWWIKIPLNKMSVQCPEHTGTVEMYRQTIVGAANTRLLLAAYCVLVVGIGILAVLQLKSVVEVDTRRKVFHGVMVAMLLPTIPIDPCFFGLALMIVLAVFLMLDLFRASQLPPISRPLTNFLAPYVDGRDYRGPVIVSHIFLLIGCAIPLWLSLSGTMRTGTAPWQGWDVTSRDLSMVSGVICVGMGDAAASLIGRRYGRTKWYWGGGKSIEGSAAFALAVMTGLTASWLWLRLGGWIEFRKYEVLPALVKSLLAGVGASVMESVLTAANDNVVVPIGLWLLVRGLGI